MASKLKPYYKMWQSFFLSNLENISNHTFYGIARVKTLLDLANGDSINAGIVIRDNINCFSELLCHLVGKLFIIINLCDKQEVPSEQIYVWETPKTPMNIM